MWKVFQSNRLEQLVNALIENLDTYQDDPFTPHFIVIETSAMARYVSMEIASRQRISANVRFFLPQQFLKEIFGNDDHWGFLNILFAILKALPSLISTKEFKIINSYLGPFDPQVVSGQELSLAYEIAKLFDRYLLYRPEMLLEWEFHKGVEAHTWQAILWRAVKEVIGHPHMGNKYVRFLKNMEQNPVPHIKTLHVFGISTMPVMHLRILNKLANFIDINLYCFCPSKVYFADLDVKNQAEGHPLLAILAKLAKDFQSIRLDEIRGEEYDLFEDPVHNQAPTILESLQSDILACDLPPKRRLINKDDHSIQIHSCSGKMREVEVLRDVVFDILNNDPTIDPKDIVVMTPDIEEYASFIELVFSEASENPSYPNIRYNIMNRKTMVEDSIISSLNDLLDILSSKMKASEVLGLISHKPIRDKFGLSYDDISICRRFIRESGIRWGIDEEDKIYHHQPPYREYTWAFGIERLVLGMAMEGGKMFGGVVPCEAGGSPTSQVFERFLDFIDKLSQAKKKIYDPMPLSKYLGFFTTLIEWFISDKDRNASNIAVIINEIGLASQGMDRKFTINTFSNLIKKCICERHSSKGYFSGGITFCEMAPLRILPFKVIILLGLNDATFPNKPVDLGFDMINQHPQRGDRNQRDEQLELFFESLLSARKSFIVIYSGKDPTVNKTIHPSNPVSTLLDVLDLTFEAPDGQKASEYLTKYHPLQPFSPKNYLKDAPLSFDKKWLDLRNKAQNERQVLAPFTKEVHLEKVRKVIELSELISFLKNPPRYFIRFHGFRPELIDISVPDKEPVEMDKLEQYAINQRIVRLFEQGFSPESAYDYVVKECLLPVGKLGKDMFEESWELVKHIYHIYDIHKKQRVMNEIRVQIKDYIMHGKLDCFYDNQIFLVTLHQIKVNNKIELWLNHLVASLNIKEYQGKAHLIGYDKSLKRVYFDQKVQDPIIFLEYILDLFEKGKRYPLPFFPEISAEFVMRTKRDDPDPEKAIIRMWNNEYNKSYRNDIFIQYAYGDVPNPFILSHPDQLNLPDLARNILGPIYDSLKED